MSLENEGISHLTVLLLRFVKRIRKYVKLDVFLEDHEKEHQAPV